MAQPQTNEQNFNATHWTQYYHCVLSGIPQSMGPPQLVDHLVPNEDSEVVKALAAEGRYIILHTLHTYKESLSTKFGYISFFLRHTPEAKSDEATKQRVHALARRWIDTDLRAQLLIAHVTLNLAQPPECYHSQPFLKVFRERCSIASKEVAADPLKLETFLFTHTVFQEMTEGSGNAHFNPTWATQGESFEFAADKPASASSPEEQREWEPVGTLSVSKFTPPELMWLKMNCRTFPPLSVTNGVKRSVHVEGDALETFFKQHLSPLITVTK